MGGFRYGWGLTGETDDVPFDVLPNLTAKLVVPGWEVSRKVDRPLNPIVGEIFCRHFENTVGDSVRMAIYSEQKGEHQEIFVGFGGHLTVPANFDEFGILAAQTSLVFYRALVQFFPRVEFVLELDCDGPNDFCRAFERSFQLGFPNAG